MNRFDGMNLVQSIENASYFNLRFDEEDAIFAAGWCFPSYRFLTQGMKRQLSAPWRDALWCLAGFASIHALQWQSLNYWFMLRVVHHQGTTREENQDEQTHRNELEAGCTTRGCKAHNENRGCQRDLRHGKKSLSVLWLIKYHAFDLEMTAASDRRLFYYGRTVERVRTDQYYSVSCQSVKISTVCLYIICLFWTKVLCSHC